MFHVFSLTCSSPISLPPNLIRAPVARLLGLLLRVLLRGIRLLRQETSTRVRQIGFACCRYSASTSWTWSLLLLLNFLVLTCVFAFCGFVLLVIVFVLVLSRVSVSFSVSSSFSSTMTIAWVVSSSLSSWSPSLFGLLHRDVILFAAHHPLHQQSSLFTSHSLVSCALCGAPVPLGAQNT